MKKYTSTSFFDIALAAAAPAAVLVAAEKSPEDFMHDRHEHYEELGKAFKTVL